MRALCLCLLVVGAALGSGCGTSAARLRSAEQDNRLLTEEQQQLDKALQSVSRYTEGLRSPGKAGRSFSITAQWVPTLRAKLRATFTRPASGETITSSSVPKFWSMNQFVRSGIAVMWSTGMWKNP